MNRNLSLVLSCSLVLLLATLTAGQTCGRIEGRTTSPEGWVIAGANIRLVNKTTKQTVTVKTDGNGKYSTCLAPGTYDVVVNALGYKLAKRKTIKVESTAKNLIDFTVKHDPKARVDQSHP